MNDYDDSKISIIIPVYNVEKYIRKCLTSVVNQSYSNIEILVINDGSTDKCEEIIQEFAENDSRIKYFLKKNGGLGSARNYGIKHATGDYISFIDSDDWVASNFIEELYESSRKNNADISICNIVYIYEDGAVRKRTPSITGDLVVNERRAISDLLTSNGFRCHAVNKLYKTSLFKINNIVFPEGKLYEDVFTSYKLFLSSKVVSYINRSLYFYLQSREGSILTTQFNKRRFDIFDAVSEVRRDILKFGYTCEEELNIFACDNIISLVNYLSLVSTSLPEEDRDEYIQRIKNECRKYGWLKFKVTSKKNMIRRLRYWLITVSLENYMKIYNLVKGYK